MDTYAKSHDVGLVGGLRECASEDKDGSNRSFRVLLGGRWLAAWHRLRMETWLANLRDSVERCRAD
jgi:hypothetical protein